jgi:hypothetical protein
MVTIQQYSSSVVLTTAHRTAPHLVFKVFKAFPMPVLFNIYIDI